MTVYHLTRRGADHKTAQPITIAGKHFTSRRTAAHFYDIGEHTLKKRLEAGMSPEQAVGIAPVLDWRHCGALIVQHQIQFTFPGSAEGEGWCWRYDDWDNGVALTEQAFNNDPDFALRAAICQVAGVKS